jgi:hypothetical protein
VSDVIYFVLNISRLPGSMILIDLMDSYAGSEEIWRFYREIAKEYGVYEHTKFEHQVVGAKWNEDLGRWTVNVKDLKTGDVIDDSAEVLINCSGALKYDWITSLVHRITELLADMRQ